MNSSLPPNCVIVSTCVVPSLQSCCFSQIVGCWWRTISIYSKWEGKFIWFVRSVISCLVYCEDLWDSLVCVLKTCYSTVCVYLQRCVCVSISLCVCLCVCAWVVVSVYACACVCLCVCLRAHCKLQPRCLPHKAPQQYAQINDSPMSSIELGQIYGKGWYYHQKQKDLEPSEVFLIPFQLVVCWEWQFSFVVIHLCQCKTGEMYNINAGIKIFTKGIIKLGREG